MIVFLHIPRTGGITLTDVLSQHYSVWRVGEYELAGAVGKFADNFDCIAGHIPYGVHRLVRGEVRYITMLRDPVERIASDYFWRRNRDGWKQEGLKVLADAFPLTEFGRQPMAELDNLQTRYLAGMQISFPVGMPVTEYDCDRALANLKTFAAVGITEAYAESVERFAEVLGWEDFTPPGISNSSDRSSVSPLTSKIIRERNQFDQRLYDWVRERYDA